MKNIISLGLILILLTGCTVRGGWPRFLRRGESSGWSGPKADNTYTTNKWILDIQKREGTNYLGIHLGMISLLTKGQKKWDSVKNCYCGEELPPSVMMYSATSGQCLRWISYKEFEAVYILKNKSEYPVKY